MDILERFDNGDIRALAKVVSFVENRQDGYQDLLGKLYHRVGHSVRIGITGPPGAGKSTLVNALTHEYVGAGRKIGIIAVDPTSPFTGGALLGDRVRMSEFPTDGRVYFRSMATRGATGGLAAATGNVAVVFDAFSFDVTLIETVGVGQMELDVVDACDTVVVVVVPESGDAVQTMKAGLMEIADVLCVNKADRAGAERLVFELEQAIDSRKKSAGAWPVPVLATEAVNRKNTDQLHGKINEHLDFVRASGTFEHHRREQLKKVVLNILHRRFEQEFLERLMQKVQFDKIVDDIYSGRSNPFLAGNELYEQFADSQS